MTGISAKYTKKNMSFPYEIQEYTNLSYSEKLIEVQKVASYVQSIDQLNNFEKKRKKKEQVKIRNVDKKHDVIFEKCLRGFLHAKCKNENCNHDKPENVHHFIKKVLCGLEWCGDCGQKNSDIHLRRVARWYDKIFETDYLAHLTVTVPDECIHAFYGSFNPSFNRKKLSDFRLYVKRYLQRLGFDKGLSRYHWAGDCLACKGEGCEHCNFTGLDTRQKFRPHIHFLLARPENKNDLFDFRKGAMFLKNEILERFKEDIARYCKRNLSNKVKVKKVVIRYDYTRNEAKKIHWLFYNTRATWRFPLRRDVIDIIKGFKTTNSWGTWTIKENNTNALSLLEKNICPICKKKLFWDKLIKRQEFKDFKYKIVEEYQGGFYRVGYNDNDRLYEKLLIQSWTVKN